MTVEEMVKQFREAGARWVKFEDVENPPETHVKSERDDMRAFLLLDALLPESRDLLASAEHDQIWLSVRPEELAKVILPDEIKYLSACGVHYSEREEAFYMFV